MSNSKGLFILHVIMSSFGTQYEVSECLNILASGGGPPVYAAIRHTAPLPVLSVPLAVSFEAKANIAALQQPACLILYKGVHFIQVRCTKKETRKGNPCIVSRGCPEKMAAVRTGGVVKLSLPSHFSLPLTPSCFHYTS